MARSRFELLPRGTTLQRRVLLAEVLGAPRSRAPWHPPSQHAEPEPPANAERPDPASPVASPDAPEDG